MLLKHLYDYAHSRNLLEAPAFSQKAVRWIIDLDADGNLLGQGPIDTAKDGKRGKEFSCPQTTRNKNKGGISEFLADSITAIFGLEGDPRQLAKETENKQTARRRNNASKQKAFWEQIQTANDSEKCKGMLSAVVAFGQTLDADEPPTFIRYGRKADDGGKKESRSAWWIRRAGGSEEKLGPENFTFRVNGNLLLEDEDIRDWWRAQYAAEISDTKTKAKRGLCIITGKVNQPIAETHGVKIMSVPGGQSSGASLVSFDKDAFTSYGFQKSLNCPTSEDAAIAYCKALNALIQGDDTSLRIGGTILCFWAKETKNVGNLFASLLNKPDPQVVATFMKAPWAGIERELAKKDSFVAVTLKGCGGRVAVSYWIQEPLDQAIENFKTWFADLEITAPPRPAPRDAKKTTEKRTEYNPFSIYWLANTTVREAKELRPETLSQLYRAALEGSAPSIMLIKPILEQLRSRLLGDKNYKLIYDESRFAL